MSTIPSTTLIDILYRKQVIRFLYSGLDFCISLQSFDVFFVPFFHNQGYYTASKLLFFLTLFTEQGRKVYVNSIINNNGLNRIAFALSIRENQITNPSHFGPSSLTEYKVLFRMIA